MWLSLELVPDKTTDNHDFWLVDHSCIESVRPAYPGNSTGPSIVRTKSGDVQRVTESPAAIWKGLEQARIESRHRLEAEGSHFQLTGTE